MAFPRDNPVVRKRLTLLKSYIDDLLTLQAIATYLDDES
jgi:hypothetical protein